MKTIELQEQNLEVFENAVKAMASFKAVFGRGLSADLVAELYAAEALKLKVVGMSKPGYDALGPNGERYQIKYRTAQTLNVDINNFEFDFLILVNLEESYRLKEMWRLSRQQAETVFVERQGFRKYQATQSKIKSVGEAVFPDRNSLQNGSGYPTPSSAGRYWREIRGAAPFPLAGEDAQAWVSRSRLEDNEQGYFRE